MHDRNQNQVRVPGRGALVPGYGILKLWPYPAMMTSKRCDNRINTRPFRLIRKTNHDHDMYTITTCRMKTILLILMILHVQYMYIHMGTILNIAYSNSKIHLVRMTVALALTRWRLSLP